MHLWAIGPAPPGRARSDDDQGAAPGGLPSALPIVVGISGSSGALLGRRAVEVLGALARPVHLTYTPACRQVWPEEVGHPLDDDLALWRERYGVRICEPDDFRAPMSSGSFPTAGMIVIPCSMRTVSAIAYGTSSNLLERAADVTIKEGRRLVVVPRGPRSPPSTWRTCSGWRGWACAWCRRSRSSTRAPRAPTRSRSIWIAPCRRPARHPRGAAP